MHLDIRYLRLVVAIAETGSVTRAAQRLNLTQSALSHQLREIEKRLGTPLFLRRGKRMEVASAGARILDTARLVLHELERVEADVVATAGAGPEGVLRVSLECYTCYHWLPEVLIKFRKENPRVHVEIAPQTRRALRALADGELDVAIVTDTLRGRPFRYVPLFRDEFLVIVPPDHRLAAQPFVSARDFSDEPLVLYDLPDERLTLLSEFIYPAGIRPGSITRVQLTEAVIGLVKAGFGVSALAHWAIAPHLEQGTIAAVPLGNGGYHREWQAAVRNDRATPAYVSSFVRCLRGTSFSTVSSAQLRHKGLLSA